MMVGASDGGVASGEELPGPDGVRTAAGSSPGEPLPCPLL